MIDLVLASVGVCVRACVPVVSNVLTRYCVLCKSTRYSNVQAKGLDTCCQ